jgi:hypothetical protein
VICLAERLELEFDQMHHVFIASEGAAELGLLLIVSSPTDVIYHVQCDGVACDQRSIEGFLVPLGQRESSERMWNELFCDEHLGNRGPIPWQTPSLVGYLDRLEQIVGAVVCWKREADDTDQRLLLRLDRTRLEQCVEAWIPVISPYGPAILTFENSD